MLLDAQFYLPEEWANDPVRRKNDIPDNIEFLTKPQLALDLIDRAKSNGVRVRAWTADEGYGRCFEFLNGLDARGEAYVVEIPTDMRVWMRKPQVLMNAPRGVETTPGRHTIYPRLKPGERTPCKVRNLANYSPALRDQKPQRYRIKDTQRGPAVWEIRWSTCWRQTHDEHFVSNQCTLIVARNVLTGEVKYFLSNRVPGRDGWTLRMILQVAFGRWPIEDCFREAKEELGLDHFECRGWRCIHRHLYLTILSQLHCARVRQQHCPSDDVLTGELLTTEQVRVATSEMLSTLSLPPKARQALLEAAAKRQSYKARRNATASRSHRKKCLADLAVLGIDPAKIKSVAPKKQL